MAINLSNREEIKTLDQSGVLASIEQLPDQIRDAWEKTYQAFDPGYVNGVTKVVVAGMGGSALGAHVIQALAKKDLRVTFEICKDYTLPGYVDANTLVILSSYSGTTEETLSAAKEAQTKNAKVAVIASGGNLLQLAQDNNYPYYQIEPVYNPSNQPRMAIGYAIAGQIGMLKSFGLINFDPEVIATTIDYLKEKAATMAPEVEDSVPKQLANLVADKIICLVSAEHLTGATHVMNNQINENAKHLTIELNLPELNHHYMEGLPHPKQAKDWCHFIFIDSNLYSDKLRLRIELTKDVVLKNGYTVTTVTPMANHPFTQAFEVIQYGAYTNFYLAMIHGLNPAPIPWVDYFKDQLKAKSQ